MQLFDLMDHYYKHKECYICWTQYPEYYFKIESLSYQIKQETESYAELTVSLYYKKNDTFYKKDYIILEERDLFYPYQKTEISSKLF